MTQKSILAQVHSEAWSNGFRQGLQVSSDDAFEEGRMQGYRECHIPTWRFFALFGIGVAVGAMLL